jgi:hypothetical protein
MRTVIPGEPTESGFVLQWLQKFFKPLFNLGKLTGREENRELFTGLAATEESDDWYVALGGLSCCEVCISALVPCSKRESCRGALAEST